MQARELASYITRVEYVWGAVLTETSSGGRKTRAIRRGSRECWLARVVQPLDSH